MKHNVILPLIIVAAILAMAGCGKSAEFKKMEQDLVGSVTSMHDEGMSLMNKGSELSAKLDQAIAAYDSMAAKYPKQFEGQTSDDLKAAKGKLDAASASMKDWMSSMKAYDPTMDHTQVMDQLTKEKDGIVKVKNQFQEAFTAGATALENHKAFAEQLAANLTKGVKKAVKK